MERANEIDEIEWDSFKKLKPLLRAVSRQKQEHTIIKFSDSIVALAGPYRNQIRHAQAVREQLGSYQESVDRMGRRVIAAFEYCVLDEIRADNVNSDLIRANYSWADNASIYHRFYCYRGVFPGQLVRLLIDSFEEPLRNVIIGCPEEIWRRFRAIGSIGRLTPRIAYCLNARSRTSPPVSISRPELFRALLRCGIHPVEGHGRPDGIVVRDDEPRYLIRTRRICRQRVRVTSLWLKEREIRSASHWRGLLGESECGKTNPILYSSGTSSNEAAICFAQGFHEGRVFLHPYWYFENVASVRRQFADRLTNNHEEAAILFLNLAPATTHSFVDECEVVDPVEAIKALCRRARANRGQTFLLVLDVTMNPVFQIESCLHNGIPSNLRILKSVSITKHQHGRRTYFFGAVHAMGPLKWVAAARNRLRRIRPWMGGELQEGHVVHFPRPSRRWLRERQEKLLVINKGLVDCLPSDLSWRIVPKMYQSFLVPPIEPVQEIAEYLKERKRFLGEDEFKRRFAFMAKLHGIMTEALLGPQHYELFPGIEIGNSFGLTTTRILYDEGTVVLEGNRIGMGTVRISPGYESSSELLYDYVREMIVRFAKAMRSVAHLVGCHAYLDWIYPSSRLR